MSDGVDGPRVSWVKRERTPCHLFGATVLTILFKAESVHRKNARVAVEGLVPFRNHLGDAISQHASLAEAEIKCMRSRKRENVVWLVD
jgi:hypothetical protein